MYKISFKDRTVKLVENQQGEHIKQLQTTPNTEYFAVDSNQYALKSIAKIEWVKDPLPPTQTALPMGNRCRAKHSIHKQIYELFCKHVKTEGEHRKWSEFRDKAYSYLYTKKDKWCDYKKGTCYCYEQQDKMVKNAQKIMGGGVVV